MFTSKIDHDEFCVYLSLKGDFSDMKNINENERHFETVCILQAKIVVTCIIVK